jgi:hypothetical protein
MYVDMLKTTFQDFQEWENHARQSRNPSAYGIMASKCVPQQAQFELIRNGLVAKYFEKIQPLLLGLDSFSIDDRALNLSILRSLVVSGDGPSFKSHQD